MTDISKRVIARSWRGEMKNKVWISVSQTRLLHVAKESYEHSQFIFCIVGLFLVIKANTKFSDGNSVLNSINAHAEQSMMLA